MFEQFCLIAVQVVAIAHVALITYGAADEYMIRKREDACPNQFNNVKGKEVFLHNVIQNSEV